MGNTMLVNNIITFLYHFPSEKMPEFNSWYKMPMELRKRRITLVCLANNSFTDIQMTFKLK